MKTKGAICLDIGGSFIKYGIITKDGELLNSDKEKTCATGVKSLTEQVFGIIEKLVKLFGDGEIAGIGISSAGQVDHKTGKIIYATENLPEWTGVELGKIVSERFKLKCHVENDVNAAALGELYYGNGKGHDNFICLTIGTGIGGALIQFGELVHGATGSAGEIGHMIIRTDGRKCNCGNRGCYEQYASVIALKREIIKKLGKSFLPCDGGVEWLLERYFSDTRVRAIIDKYIEYISKGIISLIHIFNPSAVIIGGAVSTNRILIEGVIKNIQINAMPPFVKELKIVPAYLENNASLYGVSSYIFR